VLARRAAATLTILWGTLFMLSAQASESSGADLRGYWQPAQAYGLLRTEAGKVPPLNAAAREVYEHHLAQRRKADLSFDTMASLCLPPGIPRALTVSAFWILQSDEYVELLFDWNQVKRVVALPGKYAEVTFAESQSPEEVYLMGNAAGHWDGGVLVVDSAQYHTATLLDEALPHSKSLHVIERIRLADPNHLEDVVSITDPQTFTAPWTTVLRFRRVHSSAPVSENVCTDRVVTPRTVDAD
jgi:hypothetical protein